MNDIDLSLPQLSPTELLAQARAAAADRLGRPGAKAGPKALEQAAKDFESVLLQRLLEEMRNTVPDSGLLDSPVSKQFEGMFWDFLAREVADQGGLGLWKELYQEWSRQSAGAGGEAGSVELLQ